MTVGPIPILARHTYANDAGKPRTVVNVVGRNGRRVVVFTVPGVAGNQRARLRHFRRWAARDVTAKGDLR